MSAPVLTPPAATFIEVTVGDHLFRVNRLKVLDSLRGLRLVGKVLLPAIAEAHGAPDGQLGNAVARVVEGLECLPELLDLFSANSQVYWEATQKYTALKNLVDQVFSGHPEWVVTFIAECVKSEYGGFLAANGSLGTLMAKLTPAPTPQPTTPV